MTASTYALLRAFPKLLLILLCLWTGAAHAADDDICCDGQSGECARHPHVYTGTKVALLFGVNKYSGKLTPLTNSINDAIDFAKILKENGFSVRCLRDPSRREALAELKELASYIFRQDVAKGLLSENTRTIVYFAGHGLQLDSVDYFFFSTDKPLTSKAQIQDAALSRREIFDEFAGLENFEPHYIFDACRKLFSFNFTEAPERTIQGMFPSENIDHGNPRYGVSGYYVIHSTTKNNVALDSAPGISNNGVFMARFKEEVSFPNLDLQTAVQFTVRDLQLRGITSIPSQEGAGQFSQQRLPLKTKLSGCEMTAADIWSGTNQCRDLNRECTLPKTCSRLRSVQARSGDVACLKPMLESRLGYDPVAQCAESADATPINIFTRSQVTEFSSPALEASRNFSALIADVSSPGIFVNATTTIALRDQPLPQEIQEKVRDTLLPAKGTSGKELPVISFGGNIGLKNIPSGQGSNIRFLKPDAPLTLNCDNTPCTREWAAVTANVNKRTFRGWVATSHLVPALELRYESNLLYPKRDDLSALKLKLTSVAGSEKPSVRLTAVQLKGATEVTESRLIRLKNYVTDLGVPESNISLAIVEAERLDGPPFVEANIGSVEPSSDLPIAYQPNRPQLRPPVSTMQ